MTIRILLSIGLLCGAAFAQPADSSIQEVLEVLKQQRYSVEREVLRKAVAEAMVRAADAGALALDARGHERMAREQAGTFSDPGLLLRRENGPIVIGEVLDNSAAKKAGVKAGEILLAIDGIDVANTRMSAIIRRLRVTGAVKLTLSADQKSRVVEMKPTPMKLPVIAVREDLPGDLGYLKVNGIYGDAASRIAEALKAWVKDGTFGVLIDLRDANGADLQAAADIAGLFGAENDTLFELRDRAGKSPQVYKAKSGGPIGLPAMVLVNRSTRGAAELLALALGRSVRGAMLIGESTSGDLGLRRFVPLQSDLYLYLATHTAALPDQQQFDGSKPVEPDISVEDRNLKPVPAGDDRANAELDPSARLLRERSKRDAIMRRAVDVMQGLKALNIRTLGATPKK